MPWGPGCGAARELVHVRAPTAPIAIADAAIIKAAGYWYDQETVSRRASFANAMTNSGALHLLGRGLCAVRLALLPWTP